MLLDVHASPRAFVHSCLMCMEQLCDALLRAHVLIRVLRYADSACVPSGVPEIKAEAAHASKGMPQSLLVKDEHPAAPAMSRPGPAQAAHLPLCIGEIQTGCIDVSPLTVIRLSAPMRWLAVSHASYKPGGTCESLSSKGPASPEAILHRRLMHESSHIRLLLPLLQSFSFLCLTA